MDKSVTMAEMRIALDSLAKARRYYDLGNYGRSFAHYLVVFQLLGTRARFRYEREFTNVLHLWGSLLHDKGEYEDLFRCYYLATFYFPNSEEMLNNLGVHSLELKCLSSAKVYFEKSLNVNPNFLPAEQNLQSTRYAMVERWHFPMLNDLIRNETYARAILLEISRGYENVLDIGTGTGILSLFASKNRQCKSITACDNSEIMFDIATKVLRTNSATKVKLLKKRSNDLVIPEDMNMKADLLVTEILDSGVFGEHILDTLIHAWKHLLNPHPYGRVIPAAVSIFVIAIESFEISCKHRFMPKEIDPLYLNTLCITHDTSPYDTERITVSNATYITESQLALYVDFNDVVQLKKINRTTEQNSDVKLTCTSSGRIDSFMIWFTLYLNDSISLSNNPDLPDKTCWDQAMIHLKHPLSVVENQLLNIKLSCTEGILKIICAEVDAQEACEKNHECFQVPRNVIMYLNDGFLLEQLTKTVDFLWDRYKNKKEILTVLDTNPFPILGLLFAKKGAKLTCRIETENIEALIKHVCILNKINVGNILLIKANDFNKYTSSKIEFDVIYQNLIDRSGLLSENEIYQAQVMKHCISKEGIYLPLKIAVCVQLVYCDWLDKVTRVHDENVGGYKVGQFINIYRTTEQRDMRFEEIEYTCLSEVCKVGEIAYDMKDIHICKTEIPIKNNGKANAIFYWFDIALVDNICINNRRKESFTNNSAFVLDKPAECKQGEFIRLSLKQHKGILKIFISEPD